MEPITIRHISLADLSLLQAIGRQSFSETFAAGNTEANMQRYLEEGFSAEKLTTELANKHSRFYFAELDGHVIGYLKLNFGPAQTDLRDDRAVEIERIYVLQAYHGKQVGQLLYEKALEVARGAAAHYVWLGVWEENPRAIRFYEKNGFADFDKHVFKLGEDEQTDILMRLSLTDQ